MLTYWTLLLTSILTAYATLGADPPALSRERVPSSQPTTQTLSHSAAARVVAQFRSHLRAKDAAAASALFARFEKPLPDADRRLARMIKLYSSGTWDIAVVDARETGDTAAVLVNEYLKDGRQTFDVDPWYLVRQQGEWKLLPKPTDFEVPTYNFEAARLGEFRQLEIWANTRKEQLRKDQPDCGC